MSVIFAPDAWLHSRRFPFVWDALAALLVLGVFATLALGSVGTFAPLAAITTTPISLDPALLPDYAVRSVLRMLSVMVASLMFTLDRPSHQAPRRRFLEELEDHLGTSDAEHTLMAVTGWGRYAEVFSYDHRQKLFSLSKASEQVR